MSKPFLVSIPHRLGKEEALRRLKSGLSNAGGGFGPLLTIRDGTWTGDRLQFQVAALGQVVNGNMEVTENYVNVEVILPWLLAAFAERLAPYIRSETTSLLEKK
jgi:Putative polyhydroxyalkanoic acid system protein (PHA_gran_rgn)